jgi:hypothetical protein
MLHHGSGEIQVFDAYPPNFDIHTVIVCIRKQHPTPPPDSKPKSQTQHRRNPKKQPNRPNHRNRRP